MLHIYDVVIADYATPGIHELTLQLYYGDDFIGEYAKSIRQLYVSYDYRHVEVDWMAGLYAGTYYDHSQPQEVFDYVQAYYRTHDYRRVQFHLDECVGFMYSIPTAAYFETNYYNVFFDHRERGDRWSYGLFAHYVPDYWGYAQFDNRYFVIGDESSCYQLGGRRWVLMHEHGHVEAMSEFSGYKVDCYPLYLQYGFTYVDWTTPHYASSSWVEHLIWVTGWW